MTTHTDFYADPQVYDVLHAAGTAADVQALRRMARRFGPPSGATTWLEPACGAARYLLHAARSGIRGIGFDQSEAMVRYAAERAKARGVSSHVRLFTASMESFVKEGRIRPASVGFAFNLINTIRHLASDRAILAHLEEVAIALRPSGAYAVGLSLSAYGLESITEDTWSGRRGGLSVSQVVQYIPPSSVAGDSRRAGAARVERVISHMTIHRGKTEAHVDSTYALRTYNLAQWKALLARSRFDIAAVTDGEGYDATAREPGYYVFILKRRPDA